MIRNFTASVSRGEKIALMGRNGAGQDDAGQRSALQLAHTPKPSSASTSGYDGPFVDDGKVIWGHEAAVGYFAQDHRA